MFQSPTQLEDADLATHLLQMCPVKWQRQYNLMENSTPVSTRALLMVLENIESNVEFDGKPPNKKQQKGLTPKGRRNPMIHATPKRQRRAGQRSIVLSARNMGAHTLRTTPRSAGATAKMEATIRQEGCLSPTSLQVGRMG